jgi:uncharacterized membrane protein YcaP (DUF421 family)
MTLTRPRTLRRGRLGDVLVAYVASVHLLGIVVRSLVVYAAVLVGLRVGGRRELGQLTPFDLVVILLVANAVQNAMVGPDTTLQGGLVSAATLLVANSIVARLRLRSVRLRHLVEGIPIVLVQHGEVVTANLVREGITTDELEAAVREHGEVGDLSQVELAVLETDGSVSVVPTSANVHRTRRRLRQRKH